ncbi:MAG: hypothetical protein FJY19_03925 [Bacteroidetes bacterium]|nr:hypothetical protein [Bacteroidota bacterium]
MSAWQKKIAFPLLIIVLSTAMSLFLGELLIRALYKDNIVLFPRYFTDRWYGKFHLRRMRPNMEFTHRSVDGVYHFQTNNQGFRNNSPISYSKKPGEIRVLVLGDSHTFGYEVNQLETYAAVAEQRLRDQGINATVINAGLSGTGTGEQLVFLEQEGYKYQPDYIVLGFFENDFDDNQKAAFFKVSNDTLQLVKQEHLPGVKIQNFIYQFKLFHWLGEHSYLYNFTFNTIWDFFKTLSLKKSHRTEAEQVNTHSGQISEADQELEKLLLNRLYQQTKPYAKLIILDIPTYQGHSSVPSMMEKYFSASADTFFHYPLHELVFKRAGNTHVPHGQQHISASTHRIFGEQIAAYIAGTLAKQP